ncbi:phosphatidylglycerol lysyltransferase domain-containing protein [Streptomyces sp. Ru62]|uniref:phosphatidylglycerol lysyltransferase domain-containing protein n=1 Tax=Streptomyces sp. Ru62 TaxID=2080745 RepID=UPI00268D6229
MPWAHDGVCLDLTDRHRGTPEEVMELAVAELCAAASKLDVRRVSPDFAVVRSAFEQDARVGAGPVLRLWRRPLAVPLRWWQPEAPYRSDVEHLSEWYPRFVSVPSLRKLRGKGHPESGRRPATTAGPPSVPVSGPAGGDGAGPATPGRGPARRADPAPASASTVAPSRCTCGGDRGSVMAVRAVPRAAGELPCRRLRGTRALPAPVNGRGTLTPTPLSGCITAAAPVPLWCAGARWGD